MSATRLLVLGAIRTMQPVHGYVVRRELVSWRLEETTNVKPGSIYGAIRTLVKDGCVAVHERSGGDERPERTTYVLTGEGEKEFQLMLRAAWWKVSAPKEPLIPRALDAAVPPARGADPRAGGPHRRARGLAGRDALSALDDQGRRHRGGRRHPRARPRDRGLPVRA